MALIGLDIGTTGCKASLFTNDGKQQCKASREYPVLMPYASWAEQDIEVVWHLAQETLCEVQEKTGQHKVDAIGLSVHGEAVTAIDKDGYPLRPMILGMDTRTVKQNEWLAQRFGSEKLFEWTGMPVHTVNTLPKLLWIKQNEPGIWKKAHYFMLVEDFLIYKMTGQAAISKCLASRTQLYDLHKDGWSETILQELELDPQRLSPVIPSGTAVAYMLPSLSEHLGFTQPPLITTGGHDQACGALGAGLTRPGLAMVSTGTAEVVEVALPSPVINHTLFEGNISVYAHVVPGLYLAMALNHSGGLLLRWFRDTLCEGELQRASQSGVDAYDLILHGANPGPTGVLVLPHFAGSGTPWFDTQSKGAILGLTFSTSRADLAKAILEGLTYELRINLDLLKNGGVKIDSLRAIGGGAKSDIWLQLKADIAGIPVLRPRVTEAAAWGAAVLAGHGAGIFADIAAAADQHVVLKKRYNPDPRQMERYQDSFKIYTQIYPVLAPLLHQL